MNVRIFGLILFFLSTAYIILFCSFWFIPRLMENPNDIYPLIVTVWWGLICSIFGSIGIALSKEGF